MTERAVPPASLPPPNPTSNRLNPALLVFLIFPLIGLIAAVVLGSERSTIGNVPIQPPLSAGMPNTLVNKLAPDFTLVTLNNKPLSLSSLRGQIVFLNFWGTWCAPCRVEMPAFQQLIDGKIPGRATVLTVNQGETPEQVSAFYKELGINVPVVMDRSQAIGDVYQMVNLPHTFVIDRAGVIRYDHIGIMTSADLAKYIHKLSALDYF